MNELLSKLIGYHKTISSVKTLGDMLNMFDEVKEAEAGMKTLLENIDFSTSDGVEVLNWIKDNPKLFVIENDVIVKYRPLNK